MPCNYDCIETLLIVRKIFKADSQAKKKKLELEYQLEHPLP